MMALLKTKVWSMSIIMVFTNMVDGTDFANVMLVNMKMAPK